MRFPDWPCVKLGLGTLILSCLPITTLAQEGKWVSIGPAPIDAGTAFYGNGNGTGLVSGRVSHVAVDPSNPAHWLISGGYGGIWETSDSGTTWAPRSDDAPTQTMGVIAFAPGNPQIAYAGTGEGATGFYCPGAGLLRSTDGGTTWLHRNPQLTNQSFSDILVDPKDPNHLVIATSWAKMCGRVGGWIGGASSKFAPTPGIWTSRNGGLPFGFVRVLEGWATDLEVHPRNFQWQYAAIGIPFGNDPRNGVFRSLDGGDSWTEVISDTTTWKACPPARCPGYNNSNVKVGGQGRTELAISPSNPNFLYVVISDADDDNGNDNRGLGIWRTKNAWATQPIWEEIPLPNLGTQPDYDLAIIVDPKDENSIYVGGQDLYRWKDGAWSHVAGYTPGPTTHADFHSMAWVGDSILMVATDGGVYSTQNSGSTWNNHNAGLSLTQFYYGSVAPDSSVVIGGSQDNGSEIRTGQSLVWRMVLGADGYDNAISPTRPTTHWAVTQNSFQPIHQTTDGGPNLGPATSGIDNPTNRFERCPGNEEVFIAGTTKLWRTDNFFSDSKPQWFDNGYSPVGNQREISSLAFAPSDKSCKTYVFAHTDGSIYLTTNGGGSSSNWRRIDPFVPEPCEFNNNPTCGFILHTLAFHPNNPDILYAGYWPAGGSFDACGGIIDPSCLLFHPYAQVTVNPEAPIIFRKPILYKTLNARGSSPTWCDVSPPSHTGLNTMAIDPKNPDTVYVGDGRDVWRSTDGGQTCRQTWTSIGGPANGLPRVLIYDLELNASGQLVAFTFGRGAYQLGPPNAPANVAVDARLVNSASDASWTSAASLKYSGPGTLLVAGLGLVGLRAWRMKRRHDAATGKRLRDP